VALGFGAVAIGPVCDAPYSHTITHTSITVRSTQRMQFKKLEGGRRERQEKKEMSERVRTAPAALAVVGGRADGAVNDDDSPDSVDVGGGATAPLGDAVGALATAAAIAAEPGPAHIHFEC
jgi:hypothetical protein